jgi:hypothetical protein
MKHSQRTGGKNCNGDANTPISPLQTTQALPIEELNSGFEVYQPWIHRERATGRAPVFLYLKDP